MALFTKDTIERVREAVDMVQLVGQKTDLRRVGTRWTGLCPFHDERTPSFSVNPEEKLYYCFGCGEGGDAFKFVQQTEALDFQEAVELLAEQSGVRVEREADDPRADERRRRRERLHSLLERASRFYAAYLRDTAEAAPAREYLASRGLSDEVLAEFRVGYSPSAWDRMIMGARGSGFSEEELVAAGLAQRGKSGGLYDRCRGRIMFTLADSRGKVLGFGARQMGEGRGPSTSTPPRTTSITRVASSSASTWRARRPCAPLVSWSSRVIRTCLRFTRRGSGRPWPSWARHSPRSNSPSWPRSATAAAVGSSISLSTRIEPGGTRCCAPRGSRRTEASICASSRCPRAQIRPTSYLGRGQRRSQSGCNAPRR